MSEKQARQFVKHLDALTFNQITSVIAYLFLRITRRQVPR